MSRKKVSQPENLSKTAERLELLKQHVGIWDLKALSAHTGVHYKTLNGYQTPGRVNVAPEQAQMIASSCGVEFAWIRKGEGPMLREEQKGADEAQFFSVRKALARCSAGGGEIPEEGYEAQTYMFRRDWLRGVALESLEKLFLMDVTGDSMEPTLLAGDTVLVDKGRTTEVTQGIYVLRINDALLIKRLALASPGRITVICDNKKLYPPTTMPVEEVRVHGQVVWFGRPLIKPKG
jgi:phage repressor protein C with HTH and peptisase S24 domain